MDQETSNEKSDDNAIRSECAEFSEFDKASQCIEILIDESSNLNDRVDSLAQLRQIFDKYLELPSLLDRHMEFMVGKLSKAARSMMDPETDCKLWDSPLPGILSALYALSKVRGRKRVQKFLPHEVDDVEAVLSTLQAFDKLEDSTSTPSTTWGWNSIPG